MGRGWVARLILLNSTLNIPLGPQWDSSSGTCPGAGTKQGGVGWHITVRGLGG